LDYQPDILKIDGSLVKNIQTDNYALSIIKTIITFSKEQNIKTIAEYVETKEIFDILKDLGIDYSQRYYFGKPTLLPEITL
jgi:EAL domain-containing protein (putative c-di-GMP-specific phosphodiesterase class I)